MWTVLGITALVIVCVVEWWTARYLASDPKPRHSLDCLDGVADENCSHRSHLTREEVEDLNALDGQIGFKP